MNTIRTKKAAVGTAVAAAATCGILINGPAASGEPSAHAAAVSVGVTGKSSANFAFAPPKVRIAAGKKVNWSWSGDAPHNVTFKDGKHSKTNATGTYSRRFAAPGKFKYTCTIHPTTMVGKVVVH